MQNSVMRLLGVYKNKGEQQQSLKPENGGSQKQCRSE